MSRVPKVDPVRTRPRYPKKSNPGHAQLPLGDFVGKPNANPDKDPKPRPKSKKEMEALLKETDRLKVERLWQDMTPKHFVALYYLLHMMVYKCEPEEVRIEFRIAVGAATRMLNQQFNKRQADMVDFMRWTWNRERVRCEREDYSFRVGWRLQFGQRLLTDYKFAKVRRKKRT